MPPELIANPIMVLESASSPKDSVVIVLNAKDLYGDPLIATVYLSSGKAEINAISSLYGKGNKKSFKTQISEGRLKYFNKGKGPKWFRYVGVQYPWWSTIQGHNKNFITEGDPVNGSWKYSLTPILGDINDLATDPAKIDKKSDTLPHECKKTRK